MEINRMSRACLLFDGNIITKSPEFSLEANSARVKRARLCWVEWCSTLRIGVVVIVLIQLGFALDRNSQVWISAYTEVPGTMIMPARCRIDEPCWVQRSNTFGQLEFRIVICELPPALIVNDLDCVKPGTKDDLQFTYPSSNAGITLELIDHQL